MRILLTTVGTAGDVNPFIDVALALRRRGHDAEMLVEAVHASRARARDIPVHTLDDASNESVAARPRGTRAVFRQLVATLPAYLETATEVIDTRRPELVVCHHMALCGAWAAERRNVPWAMAAVAPASWPSIEEPTVYPGMPDLDRYHTPMLKAGMWLGRTVVSAPLDPSLNRIRRRLGLRPARHHLVERMFDGVANLGLWSPCFRPPASDDPPNATVCGFTWIDSADASASSLAPSLARFLDEGPPPILVTLGTSIVLPDPVRRVVLDASRRLGRRVVLLTGDEATEERSTADVHECRFAPHATLMPRVAAVVHHGGMGTTAQTLRAGKPTIVVPFAHDQFDNAARCRRMGVGVTIRPRRLSPARVEAAMTTLLERPDVSDAAARIAARLDSEDGAAVAAETLARASA